MTSVDTLLIEDGVYYPDSDGEPMADNEPQLAVILRLIVGYRGFYADTPDVHVTGDLFWYPVKGHPKIVTAPDVMVISGLGKQKLTLLPALDAGW